jgi:hypothetical protein
VHYGLHLLLQQFLPLQRRDFCLLRLFFNLAARHFPFVVVLLHRGGGLPLPLLALPLRPLLIILIALLRLRVLVGDCRQRAREPTCR